MRITDWVTAGFSRENLLCVGLHIHPGRYTEIDVDLFGFYLNVVLPVSDG